MKANLCEFRYCCGVHEFGAFGDYYAEGTIHDLLKKFKERSPSFFVATFINTPRCKEAYEELNKSLKLIWQSKPKVNTWNIEVKKNKVFMCVYTLK